MKKIVIVLSVLVISVGISSCRVQHEKCAAYSKIDKIDTGKTVTDKTVKPI
jgi:hypothetical protein